MGKYNCQKNLKNNWKMYSVNVEAAAAGYENIVVDLTLSDMSYSFSLLKRDSSLTEVVVAAGVSALFDFANRLF